jgi:hypothetical protein
LKSQILPQLWKPALAAEKSQFDQNQEQFDCPRNLTETEQSLLALNHRRQTDQPG